MAKLTTEEIIDTLKEMTLLDASELVHAIEDTFGVSAAAPVAVAAAGPAAGSSASRSGRYNEYGGSELLDGLDHLGRLDIGFDGGVQLATDTVEPSPYYEDDHGVTVHVSDGGAAPDRTLMAVEPVPGVPQEGGYGLLIVRKLVDDFEHTREGAVNTWRLHVHRPPAGGDR